MCCPAVFDDTPELKAQSVLLIEQGLKELFILSPVV